MTNSKNYDGIVRLIKDKAGFVMPVRIVQMTDRGWMIEGEIQGSIPKDKKVQVIVYKEEEIKEWTGKKKN